MTYDYLIVGAGFSGSVVAERLTAAGKKVLVIDKREQVGGNAADARDGAYYTPLFGPHLFHTSSDKVFRYLSRFTTWRFYEHRVLADYSGLRFPVPFSYGSVSAVCADNLTGIKKLLENNFGSGASPTLSQIRGVGDKDLNWLADFIYLLVFKHYTKKQWGPWAEKLDPSVQARVPVRLSHDDRYFTDKYQFMPADGYQKLFQNLLRSAEVRLRTSFTDVWCKDDVFSHVIWTGPIDEYFSFKHGHLPYRSLQFFPTTFKAGFNKSENVGTINYTGPESAFTRCSFLAAMNGVPAFEVERGIAELPCEHEPGKNEPYYPVLCEESREMLVKYEEEAKLLKNVTFLGRLADYKYYNMDQAVARALMVSDKLLGRGEQHG